MLRQLSLFILAGLSLAGWSAVAWLIANTNPETPLARLAFVGALAVGLYGSAATLAYALTFLLWPMAGDAERRRFGRRQGLLWAALLVSFVLLRLSGELSAATASVAAALFVYGQYCRLGHRT
jgi:hypothetical protein